MPFELVTKRFNAPPAGSFCRLRAADLDMTRAVWRQLGSPAYVRLYWDPDTQTVGLRAGQEGEDSACKVLSLESRSYSYVAAAHLRPHLAGQTPLRDWLPVREQDGMQVFGPVVAEPAASAARVREIVAVAARR